jgi:fructose-1,6-bisphosphatase/inositol monophosphatase family enzyme
VTPAELDERLATAEAVAREAGRLAADYFARRDRLSVDRKGAQDLVSEAAIKQILTSNRFAHWWHEPAKVA